MKVFISQVMQMMVTLEEVSMMRRKQVPGRVGPGEMGLLGGHTHKTDQRVLFPSAFLMASVTHHTR